MKGGENMSAANSGSVGGGKPVPEPQPVQLFDVPLSLVEAVIEGSGFDLGEMATAMESFIQDACGQD